MSGTHRLYIDFDSSERAKRVMCILQDEIGMQDWHIDFIPEGTPDLLAFQVAAEEGRRAMRDKHYRTESILNKSGRIIGYRRIFVP